ncbi:hypothetical protein K491DRAFT_659738 [Lophiostoma macrostomum CBS 122681]|uniref:Uncharacterized protein n=1 Tax=Lophiostoma macrostomum CBS 122681 TaxID=1314788 RepID=A0A6A6T491_9PLEO|nr:hypothetical protein K491DRAFT_659738 [Lophiostoma macrostomum CBS 122681]
MSSRGQKVTTDPASKQEIPEAVGVVTSDSLAAESSAFGEGNPKAATSKQPSRSTTTNNTDTSGATKLDPAPDAEAREAQQGWSESSQLNAGKGLGKEAGVGPTYATTTSSGGDSTSATGGVPGTDSSSGSSGVPIAPTGGYAAHRDPSELKPKGKNITEGGFDADAPNASGTTEIGTDKDPGRVAEQNYQLRDAQPGGDAGAGPRQSGVTGTTAYDALSAEKEA